MHCIIPVRLSLNPHDENVTFIVITKLTYRISPEFESFGAP